MCSYCAPMESDWTSRERAHELLALLEAMRPDDAERIRPQILAWIESEFSSTASKRATFVCEEVVLGAPADDGLSSGEASVGLSFARAQMGR